MPEKTRLSSIVMTMFSPEMKFIGKICKRIITWTHFIYNAHRVLLIAFSLSIKPWPDVFYWRYLATQKHLVPLQYSCMYKCIAVILCAGVAEPLWDSCQSIFIALFCGWLRKISFYINDLSQTNFNRFRCL